ncbi:MAG: ABC transporter ATP-binding protein [Actinobacteria bacterium]|nr:ABC transporter ATP-binding protein [Actinomycetota bacterium]
MPPAIALRDVRKKFVIRHEAAHSFQGMLLSLIGRQPIASEAFWALDGVSFEVEAGETLGIIGANGSGKSTILKLLAGTIRPTSGEVVARGEVFGLLDLGAGMHPDLSGRENIFLNGSLLGLRRRTIQRLYEQIVAFAELEQFIDTPVKHYSSGMFMRLGFAIAVNVDPAILLIDEVLAVGDARFAAKCYEALAAVKQRGRTIVFVSHDPIQVRRFCDRVLWLDHGRVRLLSDPRSVIPAYLQAMHGRRGLAAPGAADPAPEEGSGAIVVQAAVLADPDGGGEHYSYLPGDAALLRVELATEAYADDVVVGYAIRRSDGLLVSESSTATTIGPMSVVPGRTLVECRLGPLPFGPGAYHISLGVWPADDRAHPYHLRRQALTFFVGKVAGAQRGTMVVPAQWRVSPTARFQPLAPGDAPIAQPDMLTERPGPAWSAPPSALALGERDDEHLGAGWYPAENWPPRVRWTAGRAVAYVTQEAGHGTLVISACRPLHDASPAPVRVLVDGAHLASFRTHGMDFEDITVPLDPVDAGRVLEVALEVEELLVPALVGLDTDTRRLGLAVRSIRVE